MYIASCRNAFAVAAAEATAHARGLSTRRAYTIIYASHILGCLCDVCRRVIYIYFFWVNNIWRVTTIAFAVISPSLLVIHPCATRPPSLVSEVVPRGIRARTYFEQLRVCVRSLLLHGTRDIAAVAARTVWVRAISRASLNNVLLLN